MATAAASALEEFMRLRTGAAADRRMMLLTTTTTPAAAAAVKCIQCDELATAAVKVHVYLGSVGAVL